MSGFALIVARDSRDLRREAAFKIVMAVLGLLAAAAAAGVALLVSAAPSIAPEPAQGPSMSMLVGMILYFATLVPFFALLWVFAGALLAKEKASGQLETLLATPLSARTLWSAKAAAMVLPGLAMTAVSSGLIVIAAAVFRRPGSTIPFSAARLVSCWLGNPLLFSGLSALTVILTMGSGPDSALIPSFAVGFGLMMGIPAGIALAIVDLSSWKFAAVYLGVAGIEWIIVVMLARGLSKEKIVLSSRED